MDRKAIVEHLSQAEEHVTLAAKHVARQRELIAELERDGHDTSIARALLTKMEASQQLHLNHRDKLADELKAVEQAWDPEFPPL